MLAGPSLTYRVMNGSFQSAARFKGGLNFTRSTRFSSRPWPPRSYQRPPRDYQLRIDLDT